MTILISPGPLTSLSGASAGIARNPTAITRTTTSTPDHRGLLILPLRGRPIRIGYIKARNKGELCSDPQRKWSAPDQEVDIQVGRRHAEVCQRDSERILRYPARGLLAGFGFDRRVAHWDFAKEGDGDNQ